MSSSLVRRGVRFSLIAIFLCATTSCEESGPTLHPVKGKVSFQGKPPAGATVVFQTTGGGPDSLRPSGRVAEDGSYTLNTYLHGDGAPEGEYVVTVSWYAENARGSEETNIPSKLPARYASATDTPLKASVKPGQNDIPEFKLTK